MDTISLDVSTRDGAMKAKALLARDLIPLQFYGRGVENRSLQVDYQSFRKVYRVAGNNTVIEMNIDGKEKINVLVQDVQYDPVKDTFKHVDLMNVRMDEVITAKVPLEFVGMSLAVKEMSGTLMPHLNEVEVKCLPKDLIHSIEVSIDPIVDFNSFVRVKDLVVPEAVEITNDPEDVVVTAVPPRVEEEPEVEEVGGEEGEAAEGEAAEGEAGEGEAKKEGEGGEAKDEKKEEGGD